MKDDSITNSHYPLIHFLFKKVGRMYFSNYVDFSGACYVGGCSHAIYMNTNVREYAHIF